MNLSLDERRVWTALLSITGIGPHTFLSVQNWCQTHQLSLAEWWHQAGAEVAGVVGLSAAQVSNWQLFKQRFSPAGYWEFLQHQGVQVVLEPDPEYPTLLRHCPDQPLVLFVKGEQKVWDVLPISVVGTRKMTGYGEVATRLLVKELVSRGATIISGGMVGVDLLAHQTALAEKGKTVAVLGWGFDHWHPVQAKHDSEALLSEGATFITEFPPWIPPIKGNFPSRNRIVAGMSPGVVVVEAGMKSGSHITAKLSLEYGREVLAVPGPITNPYSQGTAWLINQGARLVTTGLEVFQEVGYAPPPVIGTLVEPSTSQDKKPALSQHLLNRQEQELYAHLGQHPVSGDDLSQQLKMPIDQLNALLSLLEMRGLIKRQGDCWLAL